MSAPTVPPAPGVGRRAVVAGATAATAAVAAGSASPAAASTPRYAPARYLATPVLSPAARHLLSRFTYGVTPGLAAEVRAAGTPATWFELQLRQGHVPAADAVADWWPDLHLDAATMWQRQVTEVRGTWEVMSDYSRRLLARRIASPYQVLEVMTEFWETHLHVPAIGDKQAVHRPGYGDVIRRHALGRFEDMLVATTTHPTMLLFLDAATSTKRKPNENLGRELLELHTVGVGSYTEDDVKASARILTGYKVDVWRTWAASYNTADHWTGPVKVMEFEDPNADPDGRAVCDRYLRYLAKHPMTARRIARKLAQKFVRDDPSEALVQRLANVYLANGTAIVPVLRELVRSVEFRGSAGRKVRDPGEDVVATHRVLGTQFAPPTSGDSAANGVLWSATNIGLAPMAWPRPDGSPLVNGPWTSPSRVLASMDVHMAAAGGWWPRVDITYRTSTDWAPHLPISFRELVDHMARLIHHRPSTFALLKACCEATETAPAATITATHSVMTWRFPRLLVVFLDHPNHYLR